MAKTSQEDRKEKGKEEYHRGDCPYSIDFQHTIGDDYGLKRQCHRLGFCRNAGI